jgi:hypothetical protein
VILIDIARRYGTGGPAIIGRYLFRGAHHERVAGWFAGRDGAPEGFTPPAGTGVLTPLLERRRGRHSGFLEDVIMKMGYRQPRAAIAGWDLGAIIGCLAAQTDPGGRDRGSLSHVLWTFMEGPRAGEENRRRPRVEARPLEGGAVILSFTGRWGLDPQDYVPPPEREQEQRGSRTIRELKAAGWHHYKGRFADLRALAYTTTGDDRVTLPHACQAFEISLAADAAVATPENLVARLDAVEQLYDAIVGELA